MLRIFALILIGLFALNCSNPSTGRELDGKIKGKAKLRLADGSTISQDDSDEYHPQMVTLTDGHLVLAFGSDRACGTCTPGYHNIFITKSITPFNGVELPFFNTPQPVTNDGTIIDDPGRINFALVANGTGVLVYLNHHTNSLALYKGSITDPTNPISSPFAPLVNTNHNMDTVIGANAAGDRLITTDASGVAYIVNPEVTVASNPFGFGLDYSQTAFQVRQESSGFDDSYIAAYYGASYATTASFPLGPIIDFDFSLIGSGLFLSTLGPFYSSDASSDLVLFSAYGDLTEDLYVVTSHTAGDLWSLVGFFGSDVFLPAAPVPDHFFSFDPSNCGTDTGTPGAWNVTCNTVTVTSASFDGSSYGAFTTGSYIPFGAQNLGSAFSFSAWVNIPTGASCGSTCGLFANSSSGPGFRLYVDSTAMQLKLVTFNAGPGATAQSFASAMLADQWHHVAVTVNQAAGFASLYIDGALMTELPTAEAGFTTAAALYAGSLAGVNSLTGSMDKIKIYSRELAPLEVLAEMLEF